MLPINKQDEPSKNTDFIKRTTADLSIQFIISLSKDPKGPRPPVINPLKEMLTNRLTQLLIPLEKEDNLNILTPKLLKR